MKNKIYDLFKNKLKPQVETVIDSETNETQTEMMKKFKKYLSYVSGEKENSVEIVTHLISVIVRYLNYKEAINSLECGTTDIARNNGMFNILLNISRKVQLEPQIKVFKEVADEDRYAYDAYEIIGQGCLTKSINDVSIVLNSWKGVRIVSNLIDINDGNKFDWENYSSNISNYLMLPINLIICNGGNHSQFSAQHKNQMVVTGIEQQYDFSDLYTRIEFDGRGFLDKSEKQYLIECNQMDLIFYTGLLFELGRFLL